MRRLLLLTTELRPAGAERVVYEIATRLEPARWRILVCSLTSPDGDDGEVARDLAAAGVAVLPLRLRSKRDLAGATRLLFTLRTFRPDILHAHLFHANLAARLLGRLGRARRIVSTVHIVERRSLYTRGVLERLTARRDDATVCVSRAVARFARRRLGVRERTLRIIPNGIDLTRFSNLPPREEARAALGLPADAPIVGCVGRLSAQKGLVDLIEAFALLAPKRPDALLVLAGAGEDEGALRQRVRECDLQGHVRFLGYCADVPQILSALDVFCMPSHWEGFGLALAEALAAGLPCVSTDVDSLPEVMGDAGLLVPPRSPAFLANAIEGLLSDVDLRADLAARGPLQAARFDVTRMVADYERLYDELLSV